MPEDLDDLWNTAVTWAGHAVAAMGLCGLQMERSFHQGRRPHGRVDVEGMLLGGRRGSIARAEGTLQQAEAERFFIYILAGSGASVLSPRPPTLANFTGHPSPHTDYNSSRPLLERFAAGQLEATWRR